MKTILIILFSVAICFCQQLNKEKVVTIDTKVDTVMKKAELNKKEKDAKQKEAFRKANNRLRAQLNRLRKPVQVSPAVRAGDYVYIAADKKKLEAIIKSKNNPLNFTEADIAPDQRHSCDSVGVIPRQRFFTPDSATLAQFEAYYKDFTFLYIAWLSKQVQVEYGWANDLKAFRNYLETSKNPVWVGCGDREVSRIDKPGSTPGIDKTAKSAKKN